VADAATKRTPFIENRSSISSMINSPPYSIKRFLDAM